MADDADSAPAHNAAADDASRPSAAGRDTVEKAAYAEDLQEASGARADDSDSTPAPNAAAASGTSNDAAKETEENADEGQRGTSKAKVSSSAQDASNAAAKETEDNAEDEVSETSKARVSSLAQDGVEGMVETRIPELTTLGRDRRTRQFKRRRWTESYHASIRQHCDDSDMTSPTESYLASIRQSCGVSDTTSPTDRAGYLGNGAGAGRAGHVGNGAGAGAGATAAPTHATHGHNNPAMDAAAAAISCAAGNSSAQRDILSLLFKSWGKTDAHVTAAVDAMTLVDKRAELFNERGRVANRGLSVDAPPAVRSSCVTAVEVLMDEIRRLDEFLGALRLLSIGTPASRVSACVVAAEQERRGGHASQQQPTQQPPGVALMPHPMQSMPFVGHVACPQVAVPGQFGQFGLDQVQALLQAVQQPSRDCLQQQRAQTGQVETPTRTSAQAWQGNALAARARRDKDKREVATADSAATVREDSPSFEGMAEITAADLESIVAEDSDSEDSGGVAKLPAEKKVNHSMKGRGRKRELPLSRSRATHRKTPYPKPALYSKPPLPSGWHFPEKMTFREMLELFLHGIEADDNNGPAVPPLILYTKQDFCELPSKPDSLRKMIASNGLRKMITLMGWVEEVGRALGVWKEVSGRPWTKAEVTALFEGTKKRFVLSPPIEKFKSKRLGKRLLRVRKNGLISWATVYDDETIKRSKVKEYDWHRVKA